MALYQVNTGNTIQAADLNQYDALLTGSMTDQPVTLSDGLTVNGGVALGIGPSAACNLYCGTASVGATDGRLAVTSNGPTASDGCFVTYVTPSAGNTVNQLTIGGNGGDLATLRLNATNVVADNTLAATQLKSHGNVVVEGTSAAIHCEVYPAQGSVSVGSGGTTDITLTFARSFAALPAVTASCMNGGATLPNTTWQVTALSTTAVTVRFKNTDASTQVMSNFSIIAIGA